MNTSRFDVVSSNFPLLESDTNNAAEAAWQFIDRSGLNSISVNPSNASNWPDKLGDWISAVKYNQS
jgi:hypothetical protein